MSAVSARPHLLARSWAAYTAALRARPLRTKVITATVLGITGDSIAQFAIEGRTLSPSGPAAEEGGSGKRWDAGRALRMTVWSGLFVGPLGHYYLGWNNRIAFDSKVATVAGRCAVDALVYGPSINFLFPFVQGVMEGKSPEEIKAKIALVWLPTWGRAAMVFTPAAVINYTFVPLQHRALFIQTVALGWQTYLSYVNNISNVRLSKGEAQLRLESTNPPTALEIERAMKLEQSRQV